MIDAIQDYISILEQAHVDNLPTCVIIYTPTDDSNLAT